MTELRRREVEEAAGLQGHLAAGRVQEMHRRGPRLERLEDDRQPAVSNRLDDLIVEQPGDADAADGGLAGGVGGRDRELRLYR